MMFHDSKHLIIGVKLITMRLEELDLAADVEWSLEIWKADGMQTKDDRIIIAGSLLEQDDDDFKRAV